NADPKAKNNQSISFPSFKFSKRKVLRNTEDLLHTAGIPGIQVCTAAKRDTSWRGVPAFNLTLSQREIIALSVMKNKRRPTLCRANRPFLKRKNSLLWERGVNCL